METLEIVGLLGILFLQFIYQVYKAYKKKHAPEEGGEELSETESTPTNSNDTHQVDDYFGLNNQPYNSSFSNHPSDQQSVIAETYEVYSSEKSSTNPNLSANKSNPTSPGSTYSIIDELLGTPFASSPEVFTTEEKATAKSAPKFDEILSTEDCFERNYNVVKHADRTRTYNLEPKTKSQFSDSKKTSQPKTTISKTTPALELLKKMRGKQNLKDYWKVKFILDQPVGMEITSLGRTKQIFLKSSPQTESKFRK